MKEFRPTDRQLLIMCGLLADRWRMFDKAAARSPWQPIETAPGDDELYFVRVPNVSPLVFVAYQDKQIWITWSGRRVSPSHWMPIPPLPEGER